MTTLTPQRLKRKVVTPQPGNKKIIYWCETATRDEKKPTLWSIKASSGSAALLTPDQGHFIMGCPAATLLSTGLTDEGECSELW